MIIRDKNTKYIIQEAVLGCFSNLESYRGDFYSGDFLSNLYIDKENAERLYTEEEHQAGIEAAVKEHISTQSPVEVSQAEADAIEWYKEIFRGAWERAALSVDDWESSPHSKTIYTWTYDWVLQIIKRGYTVKPDPLRKSIEEILEKHENDESFGPAVSAIMELISNRGE